MKLMKKVSQEDLEKISGGYDAGTCLGGIASSTIKYTISGAVEAGVDGAILGASGGIIKGSLGCIAGLLVSNIIGG